VLYGDTQILHIAGLLECYLASDSEDYSADGFIHRTPNVPLADVITVPGAARALAVAGTTATVTVVPGVTTYAQIAADWAANPAAVALARLAGDAGTFPVGYSGHTANLGQLVQTVIRCPPGLTPPATQFPALAVYRRSTPDINGPGPLRRHSVEIAIGFTLGLVTEHSTEDMWGVLYSVVLILDEALQRRSHPNYPVGADRGKALEEIAGIHSIELVSVPSYSAGLPDGPEEGGAYPAVECVARMIHTARYEPSNKSALDHLALSFREIRPGGSTLPGVTVNTFENL